MPDWNFFPLLSIFAAIFVVIICPVENVVPSASPGLHHTDVLCAGTCDCFLQEGNEQLTTLQLNREWIFLQKVSKSNIFLQEREKIQLFSPL